MRKVLLIGKLNEIVRSVYECLVDDFQVQICTEEVETIKGMIKITMPELVIVNQIGIVEVDREILVWLEKYHPDIPVVIISTKEDWNKYESYCESEQFDKLIRPVGKEELIKKCYAMLDMGFETWEKEKVREQKKILVVDDSPLLLRNMKAILEERYKVIIATSGEQALKFAPAKKPDLILLDYEMPEVDGKQVYEKLKKDEITKDIPVIFLTAMADKEHIYAALETRPAGYILKPPNKERLFQSIEEVLSVNDI